MTNVGNRSCFVGLYDGYCGTPAANHTHQLFHKILSEELMGLTNPKSLHTDLPDPQQAQDNDRILEQLNKGTGAGDVTEGKQSQQTGNLKPHTTVLRAFCRAYRRMDEYLAHGIDEKSWYVAVSSSGCPLSARACDQLTFCIVFCKHFGRAPSVWGKILKQLRGCFQNS